MRNPRLATIFCFGALVLLGACGPDTDLTGHGCGEQGAPVSCGASCVEDTGCGVGTYCGSDKTCTADCNPTSALCPDNRACSDRGKCLPVQGGNGDGGTPFDRDGACAVLSSQATLEKSPVDVILVVDNSGSMANEIKGVQTNINTNFAQIIQMSGLDYRVILVSKHGKADDDEDICIDKPLSGNMTCNPPAATPVNTANFFHYSEEIDSHDSFARILDSYNDPDPSGASPTGWSAWLRPAAVKHFIVITDDESNMDEMDFEQDLFALNPKNFGDATKRNYIFHSILGLKENTPVTMPWQPGDAIQTTKCAAPVGDETPPDEGQRYQRLSKLTGGLRYPICQYQNFDAVFKAVAAGVIASSQVACEFSIPPAPDGSSFSSDSIAIAYTPGVGGSTQYFNQSATAAACGAGNSFYVESNRIFLCPATCTALKADTGAKLEVLFTCGSTIL